MLTAMLTPMFTPMRTPVLTPMRTPGLGTPMLTPVLTLCAYTYTHSDETLFTDGLGIRGAGLGHSLGDFLDLSEARSNWPGLFTDGLGTPGVWVWACIRTS